MKSVFVRFYIVYLILIILTGAATVHAQHDPAAVIESSLRAIGTRGDIAAVRNIRAIADCTGPRRNYKTEVYSATSGRLIFRQTSPGQFYVGQTNGKVFWSRGNETGDNELGSEKAAFAWRSHDFQRLAMEVGGRFKDLSYQGEETFGGKNALKFTATDELGRPARVFFEKGSKLFLGFVIQDPFSDSPEPIRTVFNEWKQVGKLTLPSKVTATDKQGDFVLNFTEISLNKIDEKMFEVPRDVVAMIELYELHQQARADHFGRNAEAMVSAFGDDFTNIAHGKISKPSREASLARIKNYFGRSTFLEWDDITPPVIKVSDDTTMAYVIVHKRVRLLSKGDDGKTTEQTEVFAWVALYRKIAGKWQLKAVASTNTPEDDK